MKIKMDATCKSCSESTYVYMTIYMLTIRIYHRAKLFWRRKIGKVLSMNDV